MAIKGYVVRGTHRRGWPVFAYDHSGAFGGPSETDIPLHVFPSLDTASGARAHMVRCGCSDVAIFRVLDDGREERLPSYEEALALLDGATSSDAYLANVSTQLLATMRENDRLRAIEPADPIAALEAAERRLLEAGGWHLCSTSAGFGVERWRRASAPDAHESRTVALTIERRRLAAKGGV